MTVYREHELLRTIGNTRSRILLASYSSREQRDRATLAATALADLLDLLDSAPGSLLAGVREREHSRPAPPNGSPVGTRAHFLLRLLGPVIPRAVVARQPRPTPKPHGNGTSGGTRAHTHRAGDPCALSMAPERAAPPGAFRSGTFAGRAADGG